MAEEAPCIDASFKLTISSDGLEACLNLTPAEGGGKELLREDILDKLAEMGVIEGRQDDEAIDAALASGTAAGVVVARGRPAQHGKDGWLESLVPDMRSRKPREDESGHVDYRDLGEILTVHPDDKLMLRHAPTGGAPGLTLLAEVIPATPGKEMLFASNLSGTVISADNPNLLLAAIAGQPVAVRGGTIVEPIFKIAAVNAASGHISFDGTIVIKGDVSAGMKVQASGDIQIGGMAEMATLEAGGSISIKGGALGSLGRKSPSEHYIRCGGDFSAAYAQQVRVEAGDSIFIEDLAMQCELQAANHIRVGNKRRGHIIGGILRANLSITGKVIGSSSRPRTRLEIGVDPSLQKQISAMTKDREAKETQLFEVSKLLAFAQKNPGKMRPEMLAKANATYDALWKDIASLRDELEQMNKKIELSQEARVVVEQAIHEGVEVLMGSQHFKAVGAQGACTIGLTNGKLGLIA